MEPRDVWFVLGGLGVILATVMIGRAGEPRTYASVAAITEPVESGLVDWTRSVIRATGRGLPPASGGARSIAQAKLLARRAAMLDGYRNLLRAAGALRYDSSRAVSAAVQAHVIQGFVTGARVVEESAGPDGSFTVTLEAPLYGLQGIAWRAAAAAVPGAGSGTAGGGAPGGGGGPASGLITGLIIDGRGLGLRPALLPRVVGSEGEEIYGPAGYPSRFADPSGPVSYVLTIEDAWDHPRAGQDPVVFRAVAAGGKNVCDMVVSAVDARAIECLSQTQDFLGRGAIVVVIGE